MLLPQGGGSCGWNCLIAASSIPQHWYDSVLAQVNYVSGGLALWNVETFGGGPVVDRSSAAYQQGERNMAVAYTLVTLGAGVYEQGLQGAVGATNAASGLAGFTAREAAVLAEARGILASSELGALRSAHAAGRSASVSVGGRTILYEPGLSASGMTLFGENGFVIGRRAFSSSGEFGRTVLHELYRLSHSGSAGGVSGALATQETAAAAGFAERAAAALGL